MALFAFTTDQSKPINSIQTMNDGNVRVVYHSNPNKFYDYVAKELSVLTELETIAEQVLAGSETASIGKTIPQLVKDGKLEAVQVTA
jgi:hypothetical protein